MLKTIPVLTSKSYQANRKSEIQVGPKFDQTDQCRYRGHLHFAHLGLWRVVQSSVAVDAKWLRRRFDLWVLRRLGETLKNREDPPMGPTLIVVTCFSSIPFDFLFCSDVGQKGFFMSKCCTLRNSTCRLTLSRRYFAHAPQICSWHRKVFRSLSIGTLGDDFGYLRDTCGLDAFAILSALQTDGHLLHRCSLRSPGG